MKKHGIGWLNVPGFVPQTWNPIVGCSKISEGCRNCYAERMAARICKMMEPPKYTPYRGVLHADSAGGVVEKWNGETTLLEDVLKKPLSWKKPRAIFVNSMGDIFHENTPTDWIMAVIDVIERCPQHLFIVLTKRAERMQSVMQHSYYDRNGQQVLKNVWLGVTAENQAAADERIGHLLSTPAAVRFVSCEPLIGPVDLEKPPPHSCYELRCVQYGACPPWMIQETDWVICGGESGPGARPMSPDWARSLRDQCQAADVPFFFKQWGDKRTRDNLVPVGENSSFKKKRGGDVLDGRQRQEWPELDGNVEGGAE